MSPAGQSTQMPMEDHQQPISPVIIKAVYPAPGIGKAEGNSGLSGQVFHLNKCMRDYAPSNLLLKMKKTAPSMQSAAQR
jgi:hypothetical protein